MPDYDPDLAAMLQNNPVIIEVAHRINRQEALTGKRPDSVWIDHARFAQLPPRVREAMIGAALRKAHILVNGVPIRVHEVLPPGPRDPDAPMWSQRPPESPGYDGPRTFTFTMKRPI